MRKYKYDIGDIDYDDLCSFYLFKIPLQAIPVLAGLTERLQWKASYKTEEGYQNGLVFFDYIQEQFAERVNMCTILEELERHSELLERLAECCREQSNSHWAMTLLEHDAPVVFDDLGIDTDDNDTLPGEYADWAEYRQDLCNYVTCYVDSLRSLLDLCQDVHIAYEYIAFAIIDAVLVASGIGIPIVLWFTITGIITTSITFDMWGDMIAFVDSAKQDLICAIYTATTASGAETAIHAIIDASSLDTVEKLLLNTFFDINITRGVFEMSIEMENLDNYTDTDCSMCTNQAVLQYAFPPCPNNWYIVNPGQGDVNKFCSPEGWLHYGDWGGYASPSIVMEESFDNVYAMCEYRFKEEDSGGGWLYLQKYNDIIFQWQNVSINLGIILTMVNPENITNDTVWCEQISEQHFDAGTYRLQAKDGIFTRTYLESVLVILGEPLPIVP